MQPSSKAKPKQHQTRISLSPHHYIYLTSLEFGCLAHSDAFRVRNFIELSVNLQVGLYSSLGLFEIYYERAWSLCQLRRSARYVSLHS
jgi:hypothetical protein